MWFYLCFTVVAQLFLSFFVLRKFIFFWLPTQSIGIGIQENEENRYFYHIWKCWCWLLCCGFKGSLPFRWKICENKEQQQQHLKKCIKKSNKEKKGNKCEMKILWKPHSNTFCWSICTVYTQWYFSLFRILFNYAANKQLKTKMNKTTFYWICIHSVFAIFFFYYSSHQ